LLCACLVKLGEGESDVIISSIDCEAEVEREKEKIILLGTDRKFTYESGKRGKRNTYFFFAGPSIAKRGGKKL